MAGIDVSDAPEQNSWIRISRRLAKSDLWLQEPFTRGQAWVDLLMIANWKNGAVRIRGVRIDLQRGQVAASAVFLADRWKWSRGKVQRFLNELENEQRIEQQKNNVTNVVTIINYDYYQSNGQQVGQQTGSKRAANDTANGQQTDTQEEETRIKERKEGEERPLPNLEKLIDGWNRLKSFKPEPLHANAPHTVALYSSAWSNPSMREHLANPQSIIDELRKSTWLHGKSFSLASFLEQSGDREPKLLKLMRGAYRQFDDTDDDDEPEVPERVVTAEGISRDIAARNKRDGKVF